MSSTPPTPPPQSRATISSPTAPPDASVSPESVQPSAAAVLSDSVVYVSMQPGTDSSGVSAEIQRIGSASGSVFVAMIDGGFDPVAVPAEVGDTLLVAIHHADGTTRSGLSVVTRRNPPSIVRTVPAAGRTDVALNTSIVIVFSEPMDSATVANGISLQLNGVEIPTAPSYSVIGGGAIQVALQPIDSLAAGKTYEIVVAGSALNLIGESLTSPLVIPFTTAVNDSSGPGPKPPVAVAVAPISINAAWRTTDTTIASVTRGAGYAGRVAMTATGAPAGVTVSFIPATIPAGESSTTVEVSVADSVASGTYPIVINAAGTGVTTATATLNVAVVGTFTLGAANPTALNAEVGATGVTSTIAITRSPLFTFPVELVATGAPAGMTTSLNPASPTGAVSTLSVTADSTVANGTYPLVVYGNSIGVSRSTPVAVTVTGSAVAVVFATSRPTQGVAIQAFTSKTNSTENPAVDTIPIHGAIRWESFRGSHTVVSTGFPSFTGTNTLLTPTGHSVVFNAAGTYTYTCGIHPEMTGTVVVR